MSGEEMSTEAVREMLRKQRQDSIDTIKQQLAADKTWSDHEDLVRLSLSELTSRLSDGSFTPRQALHAYQHKALKVHESTNCLIGFITEAEEWATLLEAQPPEERGPLYGVPCSVKDGVSVKGYYDTRGLVAMTKYGTARDDCVAVKALKQLGAIPFCRTNFTQAYASYDSSNPIFGHCVNPHNPARIAGGSSGGEAALMAGGGAALGVGTDIGGSVRAPAVWCGCCALKPTSSRISIHGPWESEEDIPIPPCLGLYAEDVDGIAQAMRHLLTPAMFDLDPRLPPFPFRDEVYNGDAPLTIGYYTDDGYRNAIPAACRALHRVKDLLEAKGHKLVAWRPPRVEFSMFIWIQVMCAESREALVQAMEEDIVDQAIAHFIGPLRMTEAELNLEVEKLKVKHPKAADLLAQTTGIPDVSSMWQVSRDIQAFRDEVWSSWKGAGLDAVIMPGFTFPATTVGHAEATWWGGGSFQILYNVLNWPAGVVPAGVVTADDVKANTHYESPGDDYAEFVKTDMEGSEGLPLSVQVATPNFREELCLRVLNEIHTALRSQGSGA